MSVFQTNAKTQVIHAGRDKYETPRAVRTGDGKNINQINSLIIYFHCELRMLFEICARVYLSMYMCILRSAVRLFTI